MKYLFLAISIFFLLISCKEEESINNLQENNLYFPPVNSDQWSSIKPTELGWSDVEIESLVRYLEDNHTRAFIILKDGKIVIEEYFGNKISGTELFDENSYWYWASAGKSLTSVLVGIAQQEGSLKISNPASDYLGKGWTNLTEEKENLITLKHQLTMTTGLDYETDDLDCTNSACLNYKADAGNQWYYHNAPYTLLEKVVEEATGIGYNDYTDQK